MRAPDIIQLVSFATGVDIPDIGSGRQTDPVVRARHIAMYLCEDCLDDSQTEIGAAFGKRDHSTVSYAVTKIGKEMETDATLKALVNSLKAAIEYRDTLDALGKADVLGVARDIALHPRRGVMAASTTDLAALAVFALDIWEVASCAEALAFGIREMDVPEPHDAKLPAMRSFADAIIDEMSHIAGPRPSAPPLSASPDGSLLAGTPTTKTTEERNPT